MEGTTTEGREQRLENSLEIQFAALTSKLCEQKTINPDKGDFKAIEALYGEAAHFYKHNLYKFFSLPQQLELSTHRKNEFWSAIADSLAKNCTNRYGCLYFCYYIKHFVSDKFSILNKNILGKNQPLSLSLLADLHQKNQEKIFAHFTMAMESAGPTGEQLVANEILQSQEQLAVSSQLPATTIVRSPCISEHLKELQKILSAVIAKKRRAEAQIEQALPLNVRLNKKPWKKFLFNQNYWFWNIILLPKRMLIDIPIMQFSALVQSKSEKNTFYYKARDFFADGLLILFSPEELTVQKKNPSTRAYIRITHFAFWVSLGFSLPLYCGPTYNHLMQQFLGASWPTFMRLTDGWGVAAPMGISMLIFATFSLVSNTLPWFSNKLMSYYKKKCDTKAQYKRLSTEEPRLRHMVQDYAKISKEGLRTATTSNMADFNSDSLDRSTGSTTIHDYPLQARSMEPHRRFSVQYPA